MPGLEQAMLALRGEVEWLDEQLDRLAAERSRLIAALDLLEGPATPAAPKPAGHVCTDCTPPRNFDSAIGLGVHRRETHAQAGQQQAAIRDRAAELAAKPGVRCPHCPKTYGNRAGLGGHIYHEHRAEWEKTARGAADVAEDAGNPQGPGGSGVCRTTSSATTTLDDILALLDRPEWIDGAVQKGNGSWVREDGEPWACSCGRKVASIARMRDHMRSVVNPEAHRPQITANGCEQAGKKIPVFIPAPPMIDFSTSDEVPKPAVDLSLPWACSCQSRFPSRSDWSAHVKEQPTKERARHRIVDQPKAGMVDTGVPHPRPAERVLSPAVAALQDRQKVFHHQADIGGVA